MTPQELKTEIESGRLASQAAGLWSGVFPTEAEPAEDAPLEAKTRWERIRHRFGKLTPDSIFGLLELFNAKTEMAPRPITVAAFTRFLASRGLLRKLKTGAATPGPIGDICDLIVTITNSAPESLVDPNDVGIFQMIDAVVQSGIATAEDKTAFLAVCEQPCSLSSILGWVVTEQDLHAAKEIT